MFCEIGRWQVPKENSKKHLAMWTEWMGYIRTNRAKFHFTRSRVFIVETKGSAVEEWRWIDEYQNKKAYDETGKAMRTNAGIVKVKAKFMKDWESLRVPKSFKTEVWVEKPELSV
jgi:hypothetical protein